MGGGHRVGARGLINGDGLGGFAIQVGSFAVVPGPELEPRDVAQVDELAPVAVFEQDLAELLGRDEPAFGIDGQFQLCAGGRRL